MKKIDREIEVIFEKEIEVDNVYEYKGKFYTGKLIENVLYVKEELTLLNE